MVLKEMIIQDPEFKQADSPNINTTKGRFR
jgi:hypothetical protein